MTPVRSTSLALVSSADALVDRERANREAEISARERRVYTRLMPPDFTEPITARLKYGEAVTLVDLSAGGALFESPAPIRPDTDLVLEIFGEGSRERVPVASRVLRCQVSGLRGGITYRGACVFKRPLDHPMLAAAESAALRAPRDLRSPDLALTSIVDALREHTTGPHSVGDWGDPASLVEALERLRVPVDAAREVQEDLRRRNSEARILQAGAYLLDVAAKESREAPEPPKVEQPQQVEAPAELPLGWQRIVVRFVDGKLLRGYSNDFHPDRELLHLCPSLTAPPDERLVVPIARLKAVFIVRNLTGNPSHKDSNVFDHTPRSRKVEVTFRDGEVMIGSTLNYKPRSQGFFLTPADSRGNNERVYVVTAALLHMRFV